jgi:hypothetical protein
MRKPLAVISRYTWSTFKPYPVGGLYYSYAVKHYNRLQVNVYG